MRAGLIPAGLKDRSPSRGDCDEDAEDDANNIIIHYTTCAMANPPLGELRAKERARAKGRADCGLLKGHISYII